MNNNPTLRKLKRFFSKCGSFLLLFQRTTPAAQAILPEMNLMSSVLALDTTKMVIATVVGLGAYDSVAGATAVVQVSPSPGSGNVGVAADSEHLSVFQLVGSDGMTPGSWSVTSGTLPTGLVLSNNASRIATVSGTATQTGNRTVTIKSWQNADFTGDSASGVFIFAVIGFTAHPASSTVSSGTSVVLSATPAGVGPFTYRWYRGASGDMTNLVGTATAFTTPELTSTTSYWVRVTNSRNTIGAYSNTATITVGTPASIETQPASTTILSGQSTQLSVVAGGDAPLTYQWYQGDTGVDTNPVGTNSPSFTTPALTATTSYWVKVTNAANLAGVNSSTATVTVQAPLAINTHPASVSINSGLTTTLTVTANGSDLSYQWYEGASGVTTTPVGTNSSSFTTPALTVNTSYWVKVSNAGNPTGVNSNAATVTILHPAAITAHPVSTSINRDSTTTLSVTATGDAPLTYQWYQGASPSTTTPVGTNSSSFTTPALTATTSYWVKVTNGPNPTGANSNTATVTVLQPAAIVTHPTAAIVISGQSTTLSVLASGEAPLTYQWYEGASGVTTTPVGIDSSSFTTPALTATTSYWVRVSNEVNPTGVNSTAATVTVLPIPLASVSVMSQSAGVIAPGTRGYPRTTWLGWETFNDPGQRDQPVDDTTPDLGATTEGARFQTTNAQDHVLDSGDLSITAGTLAEQITIPTSGTAGPDGFTTIILQIAAPPGSGPFPAPITLGNINSVAPIVVQALNSGGDGQLWAKWELPGNEASYNVTLTGPPGQAGFTFDRVVIDTLFSTEGFLEDTVVATPPSITTASPLPIGIFAQPYNVQLTGAGGTAPYSFFVSTGSLPPGLSLSEDGLLSGNPMTLAARHFTVLISDANLLTATQDFTLTVTTAPVITTASPLPIGVVDVAYSRQLATTGGTAPYTYLVSSGDLPDGLELSTSGLLSGTPTGAIAAGFTVEVTDANQLTDTQAYSLTVTTAPGITTASPLPLAVVGLSYSQQLAGAGGTEPYEFVVSSGTLPAGLTLSTGGLLSGIPTTAAAGNFTVELTDANDLTHEKIFDLLTTTQPAITSATPAPTLLLGTAYNFAFAAEGGTTPYTWSLSSGALPAGVTLSSTGVLSGTPTAAVAPATMTFTAQVQDANGLTNSKTYGIAVSDLAITTTVLPTAVKGVAYSYALTGAGGATPYTWALSSGDPPSGISLSTTGVLTGTPPAAGGSTFVVSLTDLTFTVYKQITLPVSATFLQPIVDPINLPPVTIGAEFSYTVTAQNYPKTFTITGLPKGLKYIAATGVISGRPEASGIFSIQVRATNAGGTSPMVTALLTVKALAPNLVGSFTGLVARHSVNRNLGGTLTVTTTSIGGYSLKYTGALGSGLSSVNYAATGKMAATTPQINLVLGGQALALSINPATGAMTGSIGSPGAAITGWRARWSTPANPAETLQGYYSIALGLTDFADRTNPLFPQGTGFATLTVGLTGSVVTAGKTADGETLTGSSLLGPNGEFALYTPLYKNLGTVQGPLTLASDPAAPFIGNAITGALTWLKPATVTRTYPAAFGPLNLTATGAYLAPTAKGTAILGLPAPGPFTLDFIDAGLSLSQTNPDLTITIAPDAKIVLPTVNPAKVALTLNPATGAVSGSFTLVETSPPLTRSKVPFLGQIVRAADGDLRAAGYFLLPQIPTTGQTAANAPILSGPFTLKADPPPTYQPLPTGVKDLAYNYRLPTTGDVPPHTYTITLGALPPGLTLSSTGHLTGAATTPGDYTFAVTRTDDTGFSRAYYYSLTISATLTVPTVPPFTFPEATIGADFTHTITTFNSPKTLTVTGLPKGLKFTAATSTISGRPEVTGLFSVQIRASNAIGSSPTLTVPLTIKALAPNLVGAFTGLVARDPINRGLGGTLTVTTTSLGGYSVKYTGALGTGAASASYAATGKLSAAPQQINVVGGQTLTFTLDAATGGMTGSIGSPTATITGWRSFWSTPANPAETLQGHYSIALDLTDIADQTAPTIPHGTGFATLTVGLTGSVVTTGKTADGEAITGSSLLGPNGEFALYSPLYKNLGTLQGPLTLTGNPSVPFLDNLITGALTWFKPAATTVTRTYPATFGPVNLTAEGAYLAPTAKGNAILGLPTAGPATLTFTGGGIEASDIDPGLTITVTSDNKIVLPAALAGNPGKVALTLNPATGVITGTFTLVETTPPLTRAKVPFQAQIVRTATGHLKAPGYFLLPQIPTTGQTATNSPILSGAVRLEQGEP